MKDPLEIKIGRPDETYGLTVFDAGAGNVRFELKTAVGEGVITISGSEFADIVAWGSDV